MHAVLRTIARGVAGIAAGVNLLWTKQVAIEAKQDKIMAELDDLKAAITALHTEVQEGLTEINALVAKIVASTTAPAEIDPAEIAKIAAEVNDEVAAIQAVVSNAKTQAGV